MVTLTDGLPPHCAARNARSRSARRSATSSMPTDRRMKPSAMPSVRAALGRHAGVGHDRRVLDQRLDAAERLGAA